MIWFHCPCCANRLHAPENRVGQWMPCPMSGARIRIPPGQPYGERDWLAETSARWLVACAQEQVSPRKRRLFACACCRHVGRLWHGLGGGGKVEHALEVSENYADGAASLGELSLAATDLGPPHPLWEARSAGHAARAAVAHTVLYRLELGPVLACLTHALHQVGREEEASALCDLARDLFGNPFRPVTADPAWLCANDHAVRKIARAIYEEGAFDDLPILADALEDAGCANEQLLTHCRGEGLHARGCWAVDLAFRK